MNDDQDFIPADHHQVDFQKGFTGFPSSQPDFIPYSPAVAASAAGPAGRFFTHAAGIPEGVASDPNAYLNPFSRAYWQQAKKEGAAATADPLASVGIDKNDPGANMIPGSNIIRDTKSGNYAGAGGDLVNLLGNLAMLKGMLKGGKISGANEPINPAKTNVILHDIPDYTVRPAQVTPENLIDTLRSRTADVHGNRPATVEPGFNDATQTYVRPSRMGTRQGIEDMLVRAKKGGSGDIVARVDAHKVSKTEIGQNVAADETGIADTPKTGLAAFKQYGPNDPGYIHNPAELEPVTASQVRAASSPNPPRSSLAKNQKQLASFNSKADVENFQEQAAQELFGKSFKDLPVNDPLMRYKATLRATQLQTAARSRK